jgi:HK97 family phage major capsid protein
MARILAGGYTDLEIQKLTNGNGTSEPNGIVTVLSAAASSRVRLTTGGTFSVADLYSAWEHVPVRFRSNASWLMHTVVQDKIRQFGATYGSNYVVDLGTPMIQNLLGAGVHVTDYMSQGTTNTTANVPWLIVGDFGHMVVPRRQGMSVEAIPMLFDTTTGRPTGQRGLFAWARVGATADTTTAFAMLTNVT